MPFFQENILKFDNVWLWKIEEAIEALVLPFSGQIQILSELEKISNQNRRRQFIATRYILHEVLGIDQLTKDQNGKPFLLHSNLKISLSHDKDFVALKTSTQKCGIDIQRISTKTLIIKHKFVNRHDVYSESIDANLLTILWAAKEALYKVNGTPDIFFKDHMTITATDEENILKGCINHPNFQEEYLLKVVKIENYYLVYTLN